MKNTKIKKKMPVIKSNVGKWCKCGDESSKLHPCPFNEEIHNDSKALCNCCENCKYECSRDI